MSKLLILIAFFSFVLQVGCGKDVQPSQDSGIVEDEDTDVTDDAGPDADVPEPDAQVPDADPPEDAGVEPEPDADAGVEPDADASTPDADEEVDPFRLCQMDCNYQGRHADQLDCDYDGLSNAEEQTLGTDSCDNDTDGDGLNDLEELQNGADPLLSDSDGDGLDDADELFFEFDPVNPDSLGDGTLDGDRWIVSACDDPQSEPVDYFTSAQGDWKVGLPPAFSNYSQFQVPSAAPKVAAAVFDDPANEVAGFLLSKGPASGQSAPVDVLLDATTALNSQFSVLQDSVGGEFETHDFNYAAIGRYLVQVRSGAASARLARDKILFQLAPFSESDVDAGRPNTAGIEYTQFRVYMSATYRPDAVRGDRVIYAVAVAPAEKFDTRDKVKFRMDDLTNTTNVSQAGDQQLTRCSTFRAGEGNPEADFYWVLDQSGSMDDDYTRVKSVASLFFGELINTALDYRIGVTNMDDVINGRVRYPPGWHTDEATFTSEIDQYVIACSGCGPDSGWAEWGMRSAMNGIEWMRSSQAPQNIRIRASAQLITIFMADEEDQAIQNDELGTTAGDMILEEYKQFFTQQAIVFAIVGHPGCGSSDGEAYRQVALATGGSFASLCATDISETINEIIYAATGLASNYQLVDTPISSSLRVFKNGEWVPRSRQNGFDYFAQTNSIAFFGDYRPEPADPTQGRYGDDIAVSYQTFLDTTKTPTAP